MISEILNSELLFGQGKVGLQWREKIETWVTNIISPLAKDQKLPALEHSGSHAVQEVQYMQLPLAELSKESYQERSS